MTISIVISGLVTVPKGLEKKLVELEIKERIEAIKIISTGEVNWNTWKSPVNRRRLTVTQNSVKTHHLQLV